MSASRASKREPKSELKKAVELVAITWSAFVLSDGFPARLNLVGQAHARAIKKLIRRFEGMP